MKTDEKDSGNGNESFSLLRATFSNPFFILLRFPKP